MITCYVMSLLSLILVTTAFLQSFFKFSVFQANHLTFMILTAIVYLLTETLVIFFFVDIGMQIKESTLHKKLDPQFHRRSIAIKRRVFPPLMSNLLWMVAVFVLVGAVDTHQFPQWAYRLLFLGGILHLGKTKRIENQGFREYTEIVREMGRVPSE